MDGEQAWHSGATFVFMPHEMSGPLRRHHEDVYIFRRFDEPIVNRETVRERKKLSGRHRLGYIARVNVGCNLIRHKHHDNVGLGCSLGYG